MKKFNYLLLSMLMAVSFGLCFTSCSSDDDDNGGDSKSLLVGTWKLVEEREIYIYNGQTEEETEYPQNAYYVFTDKTVTVNDPEDLLNGKTLKYTYNSTTKKLVVGEFIDFLVLELTPTTMKTKSEFGDDKTNKLTTYITYEKVK